jgi:outer membrane lipoprotein-sorting protein
LGAVQTSCQAQDAASLMRKMIETYQHLSSYEGRANIDQVLMVDQRPAHHNTGAVTLRFKRPNRLLLTIEDPGRTGTRSIYSDGASLTIYDPATQHYSVGPSASTLDELLPLLRHRAKVRAELDPLYFLSNSTLPPTLTLQATPASRTIARRPCYVVNGVVPPSASARESGTMHWTWYIDRQTFLLTAIEAHSDPIQRPVRVAAGKAPVQRTATISVNLHITIQAPRKNPDFADDLFHFKVPDGATRQEPRMTPSTARP